MIIFTPQSASIASLSALPPSSRSRVSSGPDGGEGAEGGWRIRGSGGGAEQEAYETMHLLSYEPHNEGMSHSEKLIVNYEGT